MKPIWSPTKAGFEYFARVMHNWNFTEISSKEIQDDFKRLQLGRRGKGKITGRETGYSYSNRFGYTVKIWTTYLKELGILRKLGEDVGWVIIVKDDILVYCARPFLRSNKNFFESLTGYAWVSRWKIDNSPLCPNEECQRRMKISRTQREKGVRGYFWQCKNPEKHEKPSWCKWDYGLKEKAKAFLEIRRKDTADYNERNRKAGKTPTPKAVTRKTREVGRPENLNK